MKQKRQLTKCFICGAPLVAQQMPQTESGGGGEHMELRICSRDQCLRTAWELVCMPLRQIKEERDRKKNGGKHEKLRKQSRIQ